MKLRYLVLLLVAAAIFDLPGTHAQQRDATQRRQQLLQRQAKQQEQQGVKRRLVSRTRVNSPRRQQLTTPVEVPTTVPTTVVQRQETTLALTTTQELPRGTTPVLTEATEATPVVEDVPVLEDVEIEPVVPQAPTRTRTKTQPQPKPAVSSDKKPVVAKKKEEPEQKKPNVETIRRYSFENEDGSFTFGYENADGSFKEETRGADCVVRGKYGYIDPEGVRREFTYVSGNPCDPEKKEEEEEEAEQERFVPQEPQTPSRPAVQRRPNIPNLPNTPRPAVRPVEQEVPRPQVVAVEREEEEELLEVLRNPETRPRPQVSNVPSVPRVQRPRPVNPRPALAPEADLPNVSVQPQVAPAPRPAPRPVNVPVVNTFDFDAEVSRLAQEPRNPVPVPPRPIEQPRRQEQELASPAVRLTGTRSFTSELVFDPSKNQFRTAVVQRIPEAQTEISIRENLAGFVSTTTARPESTTPTATTTTERPVRVQQAPPRVQPVNEEPSLDFNSFGPPRQEIERQQQQQQRPQFPVPQTAFNPQFPGFRQPQQQTQFVPEPPRRQPQFAPSNPFAPGVPRQEFFGNPAFGPAQPQQFPPVQAPQAPNPQVRAQPRPPVQTSNIALGQIDSFLSTLG